MSFCSLSSIVSHNVRIYYPEFLLTDNLLHHLKFDTGDLVGTSIKNYGSEANAISNGTNTINNGVCVFGGVPYSYITLGGTYTASASSSFTICFYIKSNNPDTVNNSLLFLSTKNSFSDGLRLHIRNTGELVVQAVIMDNTQNYKTNNIWTHITIVYNLTNTNTFYSLYVNGAFKATNSTGSAQSFTNIRNSYLGYANWDPANQFIIGSMRNFRWYARTLTATEIATLASID
jgi:hypothetical protein